MPVHVVHVFNTAEEAAAHLSGLTADPNQGTLPIGDKPKGTRGRKAAVADAAVAAAAPAAKPAAKPAAANFTVDQVKQAITESIGDVSDFNAQVKAVINGYGFQKISDFDQASLNKAHADAQARIEENNAGADEPEVDPMG